MVLGLGRSHCQKSFHKVVLEGFGPWPLPLPEIVPGGSFWSVLDPGRSHYQKSYKDANSGTFFALTVPTARNHTRMLILERF